MSTSSNETLTSRLADQFAHVVSRLSRFKPAGGAQTAAHLKPRTLPQLAELQAAELPPCRPLNDMERSEKDQLALMRSALYEQD